MSILSWNARGLGNEGKRRHLRNLLRQHPANVLFISKSRLEPVRMEYFKKSLEYYQELFTSIYPTMEHIQRITDYVPKLVFEEMNMTLLAHFTSNEVFQALNAIAGEKSLGEEGALVRDSNGFPLRCFAKSLTGFFSLKEAEALAISYALKWCLELGFFVSFVESDAEIIVNSVNSSLECVSQ
ncbi:hypothetical protein G4B88_016212 [Cannabis sativa]|uniref:RNase H type-1 domain-containing protein n=1 Tax=Cannabis sativa TaxID=3483 RepID=A0A7J6EYT4_CANSA|nr:hypothetical protein G4B88_016212 [Cannabis sativa]